MAKTQTTTSNITNLAERNINQKLSLTSDGVVQEEKGEVYALITIIEGGDQYVMPLICTDSYGNYQKIVRTSNVDDTIQDESDVQITMLNEGENTP